MIRKKMMVVGLLLMSAVCAHISYGQTPGAFQYQAQITTESGTPLSNRTISFFISILSESTTGTRVYSEFHDKQTSNGGLVSLQIGNGNGIFGEFSDIKWGESDHFLKIEIDERGGTSFRLLGISQLLSVPYALHAASADNVDDADADPQNEIQNISLNGNILSLTETDDEIDLTALIESNDDQTLILNETEIAISNGNTIDLSNVLTANKQVLSLNGAELSISDGNTITLPTNDNTGSGSIPDPTLPVPLSYRGTQIYVFPIDNAADVEFGSKGNFVGATSETDGRSNTSMLVTAAGDNGGTSYAAKVCSDLDAMGFDDWYLPSQYEMDAIYKQTYLIQVFELGDYWTSTETAGNFGKQMDLANGQFTTSNKNQGKRCRCIRKD